MTAPALVGANVERVDARAKVTGQTKYAADLRLPGMHYGKLVFSPCPRARLLAIDTDQTVAIAGVRRIVTAADIPGSNRYGYNNVRHRPVIVAVGEETRFIGDVVALVVAESEEAAALAAAAIVVRHEELPPLASPRAALTPGAHAIHAEAPGNECCRRELVIGDAAAGFASAAVVVEHTYLTPRQEHAFLETEAGLAHVDDKGVLHIQSCLQDPYGVTEDIHIALNIPKSRIHVRGTTVGGGFGGKLDTTLQVHLAAMAWLAGVPVMLSLTREESFRFHAKRHPMEIRLKVGAGRDGVIQAMSGEVIADAGPYSGRTPEVVGLTVSALTGPYRIPNVAIHGRGVYTNNLDSGAFRGFGGPQAAIARECLLDSLARTLALDPLELRRRNALRPGDKPVSPMLSDSPVSLEQLTEQVIAELGPRPTAPAESARRIGRAIAFDMPVFDVGAIPILGKSGVGIAVDIHSDGSVTVFAGGTELGQGITTALAQMTADALGGIPIERIRVEMSDTWTSPRAGRTSASRLTYLLGNALLDAAAKLRVTLLGRAAKLLDSSAETLCCECGQIRGPDTNDAALSFEAVAAACWDKGDNLREQGWYRHHEDRYIYGHTFMVAAADVEVNLLSGEIRILNLVNVLDMGKAINPVMAYGQLYGAAIQALGYGLLENMTTTDGRLQTPSFAQYVIPTALDLPEKFVVGKVETPYPSGPFGAKGIGEAALNCTTPALLNAIANALDIESPAIPVKPEHVLAAVRDYGLLKQEKSKHAG